MAQTLVLAFVLVLFGALLVAASSHPKQPHHHPIEKHQKEGLHRSPDAHPSKSHHKEGLHRSPSAHPKKRHHEERAALDRSQVDRQSGGTYLGCFQDFSARTLPLELASSGSNPSSCINLCEQAGLPYAGVQDGGQCFCGNTLPTVSSSACTMSCTSQSSSTCGGVWANSVYTTGVAPPTTYLGCFKDSSTRTLPYQANPAETFTPSQCVSVCAQLGFIYAGAQDGSQCWCGLDLPALGSGSCNSLCDSDNDEICGGSWANSVYSTGVSVSSYKGCFADDIHYARVFPLQAPGNDYFPSSCLSYCQGLSYSYFGVEDGGQCFCGDDLPSSGPAQCNSLCNNDPTTICGGTNAISIYCI